MTNYIIYASDYSSSTRGNYFYNENALQTLELFKNDVKQIFDDEKGIEVKTVYLQWGNDCINVNEQDIIDTYTRRDGNSGDSKPQEIIKWIMNNSNASTCVVKLLYIVTDGEINPTCVNECLNLNSNIMYEDVKIHAYSRSSQSKTDLPVVAAAFFKNNCTVIRNNVVLNRINDEVLPDPIEDIEAKEESESN